MLLPWPLYTSPTHIRTGRCTPRSGTAMLSVERMKTLMVIQKSYFIPPENERLSIPTYVTLFWATVQPRLKFWCCTSFSCNTMLPEYNYECCNIREKFMNWKTLIAFWKNPSLLYFAIKDFIIFYFSHQWPEWVWGQSTMHKTLGLCKAPPDSLQ